MTKSTPLKLSNNVCPHLSGKSQNLPVQQNKHLTRSSSSTFQTDIGRADSVVKAQIKNVLNGSKLEHPNELKQHIFGKQFAFQSPHGPRCDFNAVNSKPPATPRIVQFARSFMARHAPNEKQKHYRNSERKSSRISRRRMKVMKTNPRISGFISFTDQPDADNLCLDSCSPCHVIKDRHFFAELQPFHRKFSVVNSAPLEAASARFKCSQPNQLLFPTRIVSESHPEPCKHGAKIFESGMGIRPRSEKLISKADLVDNDVHVSPELRHSAMRVVTQPKSIGHLPQQTPSQRGVQRHIKRQA
jgi:hypothetical protein